MGQGMLPSASSHPAASVKGLSVVKGDESYRHVRRVRDTMGYRVHVDIKHKWFYSSSV